MELKITAKSWRYAFKDEDKTEIGRTICGTYAVMMGDKIIAEKTFNSGYGSVDMALPAELMVKVEALDAEIKQAIVESFNP